MSRSKKAACVPSCSSFSSNYPGYMHLKDYENSSSLFISQRSSMDRLAARYFYALDDFLELKF